MKKFMIIFGALVVGLLVHESLKPMDNKPNLEKMSPEERRKYIAVTLLKQDEEAAKSETYYPKKISNK